MKEKIIDILVAICFVVLIPVSMFLLFELGWLFGAFLYWAHELIH